MTVTDSSALLSFTGTIDDNTIDLEATVRRIASAVSSRNGSAMASALDQIIAGGPIGDAQAVIDAIVSIPTNQAVQTAVQEMLPTISGGHAQANVVIAEAGDQLLAIPVAWIRPFGADVAQGARGGVSGYDGRSVGAAVGIYGRFTEDLRAGIALSYADTIISGRGASDSSVDLDTIQATIYGAYEIDRKTRLNVLGALGSTSNESRRAIDFGGLDRTAGADYDSWHGIFDVELMRNYHLRVGLSFMPSLAATYIYARPKATARLAPPTPTVSRLPLLDVWLTGINVTSNLDVTYDVLAGNDHVTATFEGGGGAFVTESLDPAPFGVIVGVGLELAPERGIDASLNYDIEARENYRSHQAQLNLRIPFRSVDPVGADFRSVGARRLKRDSECRTTHCLGQSQGRNGWLLF